METIFCRKKIDLSIENQIIVFEEYLIMEEIEVEVECGSSLLNKYINLTFLGQQPEQKYTWPFHLSRPIEKRCIKIDLGENSWPVGKLLIDSKLCKNEVVYLSLFRNTANFFE